MKSNKINPVRIKMADNTDPLKRKPKYSRCKIRSCRARYIKQSSWQKVCGKIECAIEWARMEREKKARAAEKAERARIRRQKAALRPLQWYLNRAQKAVNTFRREQDLAAGLPCITCGCTDPDAWTAGHWIPVGRSSGARFDYANIHLQCHADNFHRGGMATEYEARLPARIGQAEVDRIKAIPHMRIWTREELEEIYQKAKADLKALATHARKPDMSDAQSLPAPD